MTDTAAVLAALAPADRAAVVRWLDRFGMEPEELSAVPPLASLACMLATLRIAAGMDGPRVAVFNEAAQALGLRGDTLLRQWYRWQDRALRQNVTDADEAA